MRVASRFAIAILAVLALGTSLFSQVLPAQAAPTPFEAVNVTVHSDDGTPIVLISGKLPQGTALPAQVELPVPAGSQHQWAGEILGGTPDKDPTVQYETRDENGMTVYAFTLTKARTGQVEVVVPGLTTPTADGYATRLSWTPLTDLKELSLNWRLPQTARIVTAASGATMTPGPQGFGYYTRNVQNAKAGQAESLFFAYSAPAAAPAAVPSAPASGGGAGSIIPILLVAAGVVFFVFFGRRISQTMKAKNGSAEPVAAASAQSRQAAEGSGRASNKPGGSSRASAPAAEPAPAKTRQKSGLILGLVVGAVAVVAIFALANTGKATVSGDEVSLTIAQVDACASSSIALATPSGGDLKRDANDILSRLKTVTGVGNATIYLSESRIEVNYCESSTNEATIRTALTPSGYVAPSAETTAGL